MTDSLSHTWSQGMRDAKLADAAARAALTADKPEAQEEAK